MTGRVSETLGFITPSLSRRVSSVCSEQEGQAEGTEATHPS